MPQKARANHNRHSPASPHTSQSRPRVTHKGPRHPPASSSPPPDLALHHHGCQAHHRGAVRAALRTGEQGPRTRRPACRHASPPGRQYCCNGHRSACMGVPPGGLAPDAVDLGAALAAVPPARTDCPRPGQHPASLSLPPLPTPPAAGRCRQHLQRIHFLRCALLQQVWWWVAVPAAPDGGGRGSRWGGSPRAWGTLGPGPASPRTRPAALHSAAPTPQHVRLTGPQQAAGGAFTP